MTDEKKPQDTDKGEAALRSDTEPGKHDGETPSTESADTSDSDNILSKASIEALTHDTNTHDTGNKASDSTDNNQAKSGGGKGVALCALLISLIAIGVAGYLGWLKYQQRAIDTVLAEWQTTQDQRVQILESAQSANQAETKRALQQKDRELTQLKESLVEAHLAIDAHSRRLLALTATTTDDWRLAEVEYLLRLANQRLITSRDGETALSLLRAADRILLELDDPRLYKVRQAVANDRTSIELAASLDLDGAFLELSALGRQLNHLPLLAIPEFSRVQAQPVAPEPEQDPENWSATWLRQLAALGTATWRELKALVVIQQQQVDIKPLLPPEQQYYLRNNLRLLLNQAQLALLDGRQQIYTQSLDDARAWMNAYFPMQEQANRKVLQALERLGGLKITADYSDLSDSLLAIKAVIAEQHRISQGQAAESEKTEAGGQRAQAEGTR